MASAGHSFFRRPTWRNSVTCSYPALHRKGRDREVPAAAGGHTAGRACWGSILVLRSYRREHWEVMGRPEVEPGLKPVSPGFFLPHHSRELFFCCLDWIQSLKLEDFVCLGFYKSNIIGQRMQHACLLHGLSVFNASITLYRIFKQMKNFKLSYRYF